MIEIGYNQIDENTGSFRIFAPWCDTLAIELDNTHETFELTKQPNGYFEGAMRPLKEGTLYWLVKNGCEHFPDYTSKYQPFDVHSVSMIVNPQKCSLNNWHGIDPKDAIIYELHIGTFSEEGTFKGATKHLTYLKSLGINVIEIMPIAEFPGNRNWGYDGTYMFAMANAYGKYEDLKQFLEEAHSLGMAVILDVVYNHMGPEGNYSGMFAPFTVQAATPWGAAINFDQEYSNGIRDFYLANTKYWLSDIGFDGFRMDATAPIIDNSSKHILKEINDLAKEIGIRENRKIIMIAEDLRNLSKVTEKSTGYAFDAQWCDDLNYAVYSYLTPDRFRHYKDFGSFDDIVKALEKTYVYDGTRHNSVHNDYKGEDGSNIPPEAIVSHIQNHDQVGNRPNGDRMSATYGLKKALLATTMLFASPYTPMLFMGEEYAEMNPFLFFENFKDGWLIAAVEEGRRREFEFIQNAQIRAPHDEQTFIDCKLDWECQLEQGHAEVLQYYKQLIALKKSGLIGVRNRNQLKITTNTDRKAIIIKTEKTVTVINLSENDLYLDNLGLTTCKQNLLCSDLNNKDKNKITSLSANIYTI